MRAGLTHKRSRSCPNCSNAMHGRGDQGAATVGVQDDPDWSDRPEVARRLFVADGAQSLGRFTRLGRDRRIAQRFVVACARDLVEQIFLRLEMDADDGRTQPTRAERSRCHRYETLSRPVAQDDPWVLAVIATPD